MSTTSGATIPSSYNGYRQTVRTAPWDYTSYLGNSQIGTLDTLYFKTGPTSATLQSPVRVLDFNGDGKSDFVFAVDDRYYQIIFGHLLRGQITLSADGLTRGSQIYCETSAHCFPGKITPLGDINNDGFEDLGVITTTNPTNSMNEKSLYFLLGSTYDSNTPSFTLVGLSHPVLHIPDLFEVTPGSLNETSGLDLVFGFPVDHETQPGSESPVGMISLLLPITSFTNPGWAAVAPVSYFPNTRNPSLQLNTFNSEFLYGFKILTFDFDGNGKDEVIVSAPQGMNGKGFVHIIYNADLGTPTPANPL